MKRSLVISCLTGALVALTANQQLNAAALDLVDIPLNVQTRVQPNILLLVDDSGSMDNEVLRPQTAISAYSSWNYRAESFQTNENNVIITPNQNNEEEMLEVCPGYNVMYYNPNIQYLPWTGVDEADVPYGDMSITAARVNAYHSSTVSRSPSTSNWPEPGAYHSLEYGLVDLLNNRYNGQVPGYVPWTDTNNNGIFDQGECGDTANGNTAGMRARFIPLSSMTAAEQTNFANWFTYYRKRDFVVKKALSDIVSASTARVGLTTLHARSRVSNGQITSASPASSKILDVDDVSPDAIASAAANKRAVMDSIFNIYPYNGTPLRQTLRNAGRYYDDSTNIFRSLFGYSGMSHSDEGTVSSNSPILSAANGGACQQNFSVLFTDGFWNGGDPGFDNEDAASGVWDGVHFADNQSNTLADVAMYYYENDLSSLSNLVGAPDIHGPTDADGSDRVRNEQHMSTYTVAFGVAGGLSNNPSRSDSSFTWPSPYTGTSNQMNAARVDDVRHAAWNGRGEFLDPQNPQQLLEALDEVIEDIEDRTGSAASSSFNAASIGTDTLIFRSSYNTGSWWGDLKAYGLGDDGEFDFSDEVWSASDELDSFLAVSETSYASRNIVTFNGVQGVPFEFPADYRSLSNTTISQSQVDDLLAGGHSVTTTVTSEVADNQSLGEDVVAFIRGKYDIEGFRERTAFLGALIHSTPVYMGPPSEPYPNDIESSSTPYRSFVTANENRTPLLFVGGNDGMLHAFDASIDSDGSATSTSGDEVFAYVPSAELLEHNLSDLTDASFVHRAYVDGQIVTADVFVGSAWRTYLVGGLRSGGKGVFVLDVTDPAALVAAGASASNADAVVVGEFTHPDLGFTYGKPQIAKMNDGTWGAIFGNGYNNEGDGEAKLFILRLNNLANGDASDDFYVLETNVGGSCTTVSGDCNGLSAPTLIDLDGDAVVDRIYAGDIQGNLWAFNVSSTDASDWGIAHNSDRPLIQACRSSGAPCTSDDRLPITTAPVVRSHPYQRASATSPNLMVFFGTGQYLADGDIVNTGSQAFYGVWDAGAVHGGLTINDLVPQGISTNVDGTRNLSTNTISYQATSGSQGYGWRIILEGGERAITRAVTRGSIVFFATLVPSSEICDRGGSSYIMAADLIDGSQPNFTVFDLDGNGQFDDATVGGLAFDELVTGIDVLTSDDLDRLISSKDLAAGEQVDSTGVRYSELKDAGRKAWSILK